MEMNLEEDLEEDLDEDLDELVKDILSNSHEKAPSMEIMEKAVGRFVECYRTCIEDEERLLEDRAAYDFIMSVYPNDLAAREIYIDIYENSKQYKNKQRF